MRLHPTRPTRTRSRYHAKHIQIQTEDIPHKHAAVAARHFPDVFGASRDNDESTDDSTDDEPGEMPPQEDPSDRPFEPEAYAVNSAANPPKPKGVARFSSFEEVYRKSDLFIFHFKATPRSTHPAKVAASYAFFDCVDIIIHHMISINIVEIPLQQQCVSRQPLFAVPRQLKPIAPVHRKDPI